jgi:hypothetical protein
MSDQIPPLFVGSPDPELRNSPIMEETDEDYEVLAQEIEELNVCYFNDASFPAGAYVCSGSGELLRCERGFWVQEGSCDPDNP